MSNQIKTYCKRLSNGNFDPDKILILFDNIRKVLDYWSSETYIGVEKEKNLKNSFQRFFTNLMSFILACKEVNNDFLNDFAEKALFQGRLYRYLGHSSHENSNVAVEPDYNDIYVSWSKNPKNNYIETKLYGTMTLLTCEVSDDYYGIDLSVFEVVRGEEAEVVFPTIESTIVNKEIIERN